MEKDIIPICDNTEADSVAIRWNYEELLSEIKVRMKSVRFDLATEDNVAELKKSRANLAKGVKALDSFKKSIQDMILKRFNEEFLPQFKEVKDLIAEKHLQLDENIKHFENIIKNDKLDAIKALYEELIDEDFKILLPFKAVFREEWLQSGYKIKNKVEKENSSSIFGEMKTIIDRFKKDYETIKTMQLENEAVALQVFIKTKSLQQALDANISYSNQQKMLEKQKIKAIEPPVSIAKPVEVQVVQKVEEKIEEKVEERLYFCIEFSCTMEKAKKIKEFFDLIGVQFTNKE